MNFAKKSSAFSMIEILVVVFIIGLLATLVGPNVMKLMTGGQTSAAKSMVTSFKAALADYRMDMGALPSQREGLQALVQNINNNPKWNGPYLEGQTEVPKDPWSNDYVYNRPPQVFTSKYKTYEVFSYGSDEGQDTPQNKWIASGS
ncbi:type II secretion system major pseudopilin GspG [Candidatus Babeliales bacterium]|nr:type II secretion system major pseudopilin GspG [Candidatus Babeliales bacterium]MBY0352948.1 type II secretion system major pseudopilin GspG [Candidatus Babeliales bacterium]